MFPLVLLMALTGLIAGMLNSLEHFSIPALAPIVWNLVIIACLTSFRTPLSGRRRAHLRLRVGRAGRHDRAVPDADPVAAQGTGAVGSSFDWRNPHVHRVLKLMLPVTLALGVINFDNAHQLDLRHAGVNQAPAAIDRAFRIYMLPQGHLHRGDRDDPVPDAVAARRRAATSTGSHDDGQRRPPDRCSR